MVASYSRKLECIYAIAQALGNTSCCFFICCADFLQNFKSSSRAWVQGLIFWKKQNLSFERLSDGIERKTVFFWHSLELLCARDMVPPKAIVSSPSKTKEHYELSPCQCAGYKVCTNMYLKTKSQARN